MGIERPSGRRYFAIARALVRCGYRVRVLALHPDLANCSQRRFIKDGVEVWYVGQMHSRKFGSTTERFGPLDLLQVLFSSTLGMIWGVLCSPADYYHLGKPQPINGLAALVALTLLRHAPFYVDCDDDEVLSNRLTSAWQRAVFGFWQWLLPSMAAGVTVNTSFLAKRMAQRNIAPVALIPNGIDFLQFERLDDRALSGLRISLGLEQQRVIGYAGTLALQNHPVHLLVDAFAQIAARSPDVMLLLIGAGEDRPLLEKQVQELGLTKRVIFTGHVSHTLVRALLSLATISVDPVEDNVVAQARSPLKLVESLALGVPVITGDVGDRRAVIGQAGWLCAPGDATALAETMIRALDNPVGLQNATIEALHIAPQYDWAVLSEQWEQLYLQSHGVVVSYAASTE